MHHPAALTRALEALYRLWIERPSQRMTLHDQMAVAETLRPGAFFGRCDVDADSRGRQGYTLVDTSAGEARLGVPRAKARRVHEVLPGRVDDGEMTPGSGLRTRAPAAREPQHQASQIPAFRVPTRG